MATRYREQGVLRVADKILDLSLPQNVESNYFENFEPNEFSPSVLNWDFQL